MPGLLSRTSLGLLQGCRTFVTQVCGDRLSCSVQEPERIWVYYRLYEQYGNSGKEEIDSRPGRVSVNSTADIFKLKDEIKEHRADEKIPRTTDLSVYEPDGQGVLEELFGEVVLSNHGPDSQHPLIVVIHRKSPTTEERERKRKGLDTVNFGAGAGGAFSSVSPVTRAIFKNFHGTLVDKWLKFSEELPLSLRKLLFVRDSYKEIADAVLSSRKGGSRYFVITGTPGIGKSLFAYYILWVLAKMKQRVLYITPEKDFFMDENGAFFEIILACHSDDAFWKNVWCIVDARDPTSIRGLPYHVCTIILLTTPRDDFVGSFLKLNPQPAVFFMPVWSGDECAPVAEKLYPDVTTWNDRLKVLGGVPRLIFDHKKDNALEILRSACQVCSLDDCIRIVGLHTVHTDKSKFVQSLIHVHSVSPYTNCIVRYASESAIKMIVETKGDEVRIKMETLLSSCAGNPLTAALCGYIFEPYAFNQLENGGIFTCRELVSGHVEPLPDFLRTFDCTGREVADKVEGNLKANTLYVPKTKNYSQIDAWIPKQGAFQMAVGKTHSLELSAQKELDLVGAPLFWVLPPVYFHSFTKKSPVTIKQYALLIPYPEGLAEEELEDLD